MFIRNKFLAGAAIAVVALGTTFASSDASAQGRTIWEGFHFGAHAGFADFDYGISQTTPVLPLATIDDSADGIIGGIVYGSSWQFGQWVVGTDSDWSWADAETGLNITTAIPPIVGAAVIPGVGPFAATVDVDYTSSTRARVGFLAKPNLLVYGTAGIAFAEVEVSGTLIAGGSDDERFVGFVAGAGIEATFQNRMFARVEYLHSDYGDESFTDVGGGLFNVDLDSDVVRGAIGYRFDWSPLDFLTK